MIPIINSFIFKENYNEKEMCKELEKNLKKFSETNNIYRSLLYDYNLFCKDKNLT